MQSSINNDKARKRQADEGHTMTAQNLITFIRENLRDTNDQNYRFSDTLLLQFINQAQVYASARFYLPVAVYQKTLTKSDDLIILPSVNLRIIKALFKGKSIDILTPHSIKITPTKPTLIFIDLQVYQLLPFSTGELILHYVPSVAINDINDEIALSDIFVDLLTYYVCKRATQIETNANNLQRVEFYNSLIKGEEIRLTQIISQNNSTLTQTPFQSV